MHGTLFEMRFAPDSEPDSCPFRPWWSRLVGKSGDSFARKSFDTLDHGVRIIVHNMMFKRNRIGPFTVAANDVVMFLWVDGEQYSERQVSWMPRKPSYRKIEVMPTFGFWSIVTASAHHRPLVVSSAGEDAQLS